MVDHPGFDSGHGPPVASGYDDVGRPPPALENAPVRELVENKGG